MANELINELDNIPELEFLNLDIDEENTGSVRRIEEGFNALQSQWILGFNATRYRYGKWIITWTFNPITTASPANPGGKKPVTQYGVETNEIIKLQKAVSPGRFYVDQVALKPNASGHGGGAGWRYASSEYGDLVRNFINQGTRGLIDDVKQIVIPEAIQNHITEVNKTIGRLKNPKGTLMQIAKSQAGKSSELKRVFNLTEKGFRIGFEIGEAIIAPEATIGRLFWSKGSKRAISLGKNIGNKQIAKTRNNIAKNIL